MSGAARRDGDVSFWWSEAGRRAARPALGGDIDVDVCIVGGGFTGLWTAYYLQQHDPALRIAVLDARFAGFGASGRNGGWVSGAVTGGRARYERSHGRDAAIALQRAHDDTVDEVLRVLEHEAIAADQRKGGELRVARNAAQLRRQRDDLRTEATWPGTDLVALDAQQTRSRIAVQGALGAIWDPHCAKIHPVKLVEGLVELLLARGVLLYEDTPVTAIESGRADTPHGRVRAPWIVRATEGFTADLPGEHRTWLPMNSSMIITDPLADAVWDEIGWDGYETLGDDAHVYMYAQRTADGRIAFGGRGVPYRYGSRVDTDGRTAGRTVATLTSLLHSFFPMISDVPIAHSWSGVLGVPRDWAATVGADEASGLAWAGGYVGTGVAAANLAGRTLADLLTRRESDLTRLPWVNRRSRRWEPEPARWVAVRGLYAAYRLADRVEDRRGTDRTSPIAELADRVTGRP